MDDKPFNILAYFPEVSVDYSSGTAWATTAGTNSPYGAISLVGPDGFVFRDKIDIAGWTKEGLTAFFSNQYTQRDGPYIPTFAFPPGVDVNDTLQARDYIIITDVPLELTDTIIHAGFMDDQSDYMTIKFGQASVFMQSTTTPTIMINADGWGIGSGQPTASGTLYIYRIVIPFKNTPLPTDALTFPAVRYIAQGIATEEPEFVYLTRLKRSYELQQL